MPTRPTDMNQLGKRIVDLAVGEAVEDDEPRKAAAARWGSATQ